MPIVMRVRADLNLARRVAGLLIGGAMLLPSITAAQIPARFYWKTLIGTSAVPVLGMSMSGNANPLDPSYTVLANAKVTTTTAVGGYARIIEVFGRSAMVAALVPMGHISGEVTLGQNTINQDASGFGDPLIEFDINIVGPPPIRNIPDLLRYEPGLSVDVILDVAIPIGEYDNTQPLNLG